jgi:hypothetical protein
VAARESSLLSPSGSKAGKAHRVPINGKEAFFFVRKGPRGAERTGKRLLCRLYRLFHRCRRSIDGQKPQGNSHFARTEQLVVFTGQGELEPALAP